MLKFIFGIAFVAFTSFCGYYLAQKFRKRYAFFTQLQEFNERFLSEIAYYKRPLQVFLSNYHYKGEFQMLLEDFFQEIANWGIEGKVILKSENYRFLKQEEAKLVEDYFLMLGKGDSNSQKGYFSSVKDSIAKLQLQAQTDNKRYGDLYIKIGFLCGLLILILLI